MKIKKMAILLIAGIVLLSVLFFVPIPSNDGATDQFSYLNFEVKLYGINKNLEFVELSQSKPLAWMLGNEEIYHVMCTVQAKADTSDFSQVEFDLSEVLTFTKLFKNGVQVAAKSEGYGVSSKIIGTNMWETVFEIQRSLDTFDADYGDYNIAFQILGNVHYRGVGQAEWQTEFLSLNVEGTATITQVEDIPPVPPNVCGNGICQNEPYPGENCFTCPADCGSCNAKVYEKLFTVESGSGLIKDNWDIQATWYTGSGWSDWSQGNTAWNHVNVYAWRNNYCAYVWVPNTAAYHGRVLRAYATMEFYSIALGKTIKKTLPLIDEPWNDLGTQGKVTISPSGGYFPGSTSNLCYSGYWHTEEYESHLLTENANYKIHVHYYLEPANSPGSYTLTVNPDCTGVSSVTNTVSGVTDTEAPYTFSIVAGASYNIKVVWGKESSGISATVSGNMGSSNKAITVTAPSKWEINIMNVDMTPDKTYVIQLNNPTESKTCSSWPPGQAVFVRGPGLYSISASDGTKEKLESVDTADYSDRRVILYYIGWY